jgi:glycosyltransferase involved in cell wall biosynthesis
VRDLLVCSHTPVLGSGRAMRTYGVARALAQGGGELDLLYARFQGDAPDEAFRAIRGIELHEVVPSRGARRLAAYGAARVAGVPSDLARAVSPELAAAAARLATVAGRGRVIADGPAVAATLRGLARRRPVVYNAHNLESSFRDQLSEGSGRAGALRAFERGVLGRAAESWMVSEADVAGARALCPQAKLRYAPNVVDVEAIAPIEQVAPQRRAVFVANFNYEPNRNGLRFLLDEVMPEVWAQVADAQIVLVGAGAGAPAGDGLRVQRLGYVDDLRAAYVGARCAVVPLLQGGGTPLKLIEALAYGLPTIATPSAVAGLQVHDGKDCLVAEGAQEFAQAMVSVLRDGAPALGRRGRALAQEHYSIAALAELLAKQ